MSRDTSIFLITNKPSTTLPEKKKKKHALVENIQLVQRIPKYGIRGQQRITFKPGMNISYY